MIRGTGGVSFPDFGRTFDNPDFVALRAAHNANGRRGESADAAWRRPWWRPFQEGGVQMSCPGRVFRGMPRVLVDEFTGITRDAAERDEATVRGVATIIDVHHGHHFGRLSGT